MEELLDHIPPIMAYVCTVASMALGAIAGMVEAEEETRQPAKKPKIIYLKN